MHGTVISYTRKDNHSPAQTQIQALGLASNDLEVLEFDLKALNIYWENSTLS